MYYNTKIRILLLLSILTLSSVNSNYSGIPIVIVEEIIDPFAMHNIIPIKIYFSPGCGLEWLDLVFYLNYTQVGTFDLDCQGSSIDWVINSTIGANSGSKGSGLNNIEFSDSGISLGGTDIVEYFAIDGLFVNGSENYYELTYINATQIQTETTFTTFIETQTTNSTIIINSTETVTTTGNHTETVTDVSTLIETTNLTTTQTDVSTFTSHTTETLIEQITSIETLPIEIISISTFEDIETVTAFDLPLNLYVVFIGLAILPILSRRKE